MTRSIFAPCKAQVSTEYALVVAFALMVLVGGAYFIYPQMHATVDAVDEAQLTSFAHDILDGAETVYYAGAGARRTIATALPAGVQRIRVNRSDSSFYELTISTPDGDRFFRSPVPLNITPFASDAGRGKKSVVLETFERQGGTPFVLMTFGDRCPIASDYDLVGNDCIVNINDITAISSCIAAGARRPGSEWNDVWYTCYPADFDGNCTITQADADILISYLGQQVC